ncbi:MAG TPA: DUF433 domain-containing protein [Candidatus Baltobacteraceae bacterium]|nr:DUF433 domain-containing protein [Candidatus Baltobacteraceae bacterium]
MPVTTLRIWVYGTGDFRSVLELPTRGYLSFVNLTEAFVLHAMRRRYTIPMPRVRKAIEYVERDLRVAHPLAFQRFSTDKIDLFVETAIGHVNVSRGGQTTMDELHADLERIEWNDELRPVALFPLVREHGDARRIRMSPFVAFGKPVIAGTGIPTAIVAQRFSAGESVEALSLDYHVPAEDIEEAVRAETFRTAA